MVIFGYGICGLIFLIFRTLCFDDTCFFIEYERPLPPCVRIRFAHYYYSTANATGSTVNLRDYIRLIWCAELLNYISSFLYRREILQWTDSTDLHTPDLDIIIFNVDRLITFSVTANVQCHMIDLDRTLISRATIYSFIALKPEMSLCDINISLLFNLLESSGY